MPELLNPEFLTSTGVGGVAVYAAMRVHIWHLLRDMRDVKEKTASHEKKLAVIEFALGLNKSEN